MRLDYRLATNSPNCASDIIASLNYLSQHYRTKRFVVVGSSFSGSPCFSAAADEPERIRGIATIASHNANAAGIAMLSPRPLLLLHSTGDTVLAASCSEALCRQYGSEGSCELKLFEGDDHGLAKYAPEVEGILLGFAGRVLGFEQLLQQSEDVRALAGQVLAEGLERRGLEDEKLVV